MSDSKNQLQVNIAAYERKKDELIKSHSGKVALFHDGELINIYNDFYDALKIGREKYQEGNFSVKPIPGKAKHLGPLCKYMY